MANDHDVMPAEYTMIVIQHEESPMSKVKEKRVRIDVDNYALLEKLAEGMKLPVSECLDRITNKAILEASQYTARGLYVWKS
jgi:hypothetical protein